MKTIKSSLAILAIFLLAANCSVFMAANQPLKKDVHVLDRGTYRNTVIAELGDPLFSEVKNGKRCDVFSFVQGYTNEVKIGRTIFHGAADVFTFGLWEVAGTQIEAIADGDEVKVEVYYDANEAVERVNVFQGRDVLTDVTSINNDQEQKPMSASKN